jgi:hypothetical protein
VLHNSSEFLPFVIYLSAQPPAEAAVATEAVMSASDHQPNGRFDKIESGGFPAEESRLKPPVCMGRVTRSMLPNGIFSNKKYQFGLILEGLAIEDVGIFNDQFVDFMFIWYILWSLGIFFPLGISYR